ncbi:hypothetical protein PM082_021651 [Marasmius tenuissimus]|nr:hypothetical protein PM082_021651 [Marasmius tenuissimus]
MKISQPSDESHIDLDLVRLVVAQAARWYSVDYHDILDDRVLDLFDGVEALPSIHSVVCRAEGESFPINQERQLKESASLDTVIARYRKSSNISVLTLPLDNLHQLIIHGRSGAFEDSL